MLLSVFFNAIPPEVFSTIPPEVHQRSTRGPPEVFNFFLPEVSNAIPPKGGTPAGSGTPTGISTEGRSLGAARAPQCFTGLRRD